MIEVRPVLHIHDEVIESQVLCTPASTVVKFYTGCDVQELHELVKTRLTESEHEVFMELFTNDEAERKYEAKKGVLIIS